MPESEPSTDDAEFFPTPGWCVRRLLEAVDLSPWLDWIDPCVGDGAIVRAVNQAIGSRSWFYCDIRKTTFNDDNLPRDYLRWQPGKVWDIAMFNPPFSKALDFVKHAHGHSRIVAMLHRQSWVGSAGRVDPEWMNGHGFSEHILPNRASFTGDGKVDNQEYQWHIWPPQPGPRILGQTSLEERKADAVPPRERRQIDLFPEGRA